MNKVEASVAMLILIGFIILYGTCTEYDYTYHLEGDDSVRERLFHYPYFQDVHVMIFIGFGFLMCFLSYAGFTATSHAFLIAAFSVLWAMLNRGFWQRAIQKDALWRAIKINTEAMIGADFCAGAVLISFGGVLGRITAPQLIFMAFFEVIFYSINEAILLFRYEAADIGGSMVIHTFGAYFGLAFSLALEMAQERKYKSYEACKSSRVTDTMAMVGTLFLFCFWPSFNGALSKNAMERAVVNTFLSILTSAYTAFIVCSLVHDGKFRMVEVQNSTLAGGVAMGAAADMIVTPYGAMIGGMICGTVSVLGYKYLTPYLEARINLRDTCGIHNLHGMPGFLGSVIAIIVAGTFDKEKYNETFTQVFTKGAERTAGQQAAFQAAGLGTTLGIAIVTGFVCGIAARQFPSLPRFFSDEGEYSEVTPFEPETGGATMASVFTTGVSASAPLSGVIRDEKTTEMAPHGTVRMDSAYSGLPPLGSAADTGSATVGPTPGPTPKSPPPADKAEKSDVQKW